MAATLEEQRTWLAQRVGDFSAPAKMLCGDHGPDIKQLSEALVVSKAEAMFLVAHGQVRVWKLISHSPCLDISNPKFPLAVGKKTFPED